MYMHSYDAVKTTIPIAGSYCDNTRSSRYVSSRHFFINVTMSMASIFVSNSLNFLVTQTLPVKPKANLVRFLLTHRVVCFSIQNMIVYGTIVAPW